MFNTPITIASREQEHRSRWLAGLRQQQQKIHNQRIKKLGPKSILPSEKKPRHLRISGLSYLEARPPPTVYMPDDDDESSIKNVMMSVGRLQDNDIQQMCNFITGPVHYGFCCDGCHMDPIIGTRYLFNECDESLEVVLCEEYYVPENVGEYNYLGVAPPSTSQLLGIRRTDSIYRSFGFGLRILTSWTSVGFLDVGAFFCRSAMNWY
ncbi:uncharacterized protein OCT59_030055 [Rhizophagus irregularis]|uniref:uncharacterized protein n=1 Tax=Rhizophagus irregularis TaxID=588596 RepID=UPI00331A9DA2|nr:hypothetical protein OCT59_028021 [Rhizophagus irregularis]UZO09842.1 hypothetical protein OCT59_030055 [Rhizophagus irregularis]